MQFLFIIAVMAGHMCPKGNFVELVLYFNLYVGSRGLLLGYRLVQQVPLPTESFCPVYISLDCSHPIVQQISKLTFTQLNSGLFVNSLTAPPPPSSSASVNSTLLNMYTVI